MIYQYQTTIPFTAVGQTAELTPGGCIDLLQEGADRHTQAAVPQEVLEGSSRVWILSYWHILFDKPCCHNDPVTLATWSGGTDRMFAHRYYQITDQQGDTAVRALSYWFRMDLRRMRPVRLTEEDTKWYEPSPPLDLGSDSRKIMVPEQQTALDPVKIWRYMIDLNGHVNNSWYVKVACEYLPEDRPLRELRVEYRTAAKKGETFYPVLAEEETRTVISLNDGDGKPYAIVEALF